MNVKFSTVEISSDILPHHEYEENQYREIASYLYDAIQETPYMEISLDERTLQIFSIFTTKLVNDVVGNLYSYLVESKGPKYYSGDVSMAISEVLTFAMLNTMYGVKPLNIIPFRSVKYLGTIADAIIDLEKEKKLANFLGAKKGGILFINIRSSMSPRPYNLVDKISRSLLNLEMVRYPDNYGLISVVTRDKEFKVSFIIVKP